jgi:hypothetical protein
MNQNYYFFSDFRSKYGTIPSLYVIIHINEGR